MGLRQVVDGLSCLSLRSIALASSMPSKLRLYMSLYVLFPITASLHYSVIGGLCFADGSWRAVAGG